MAHTSLKDLIRAENTRALMIDYSQDFLCPETRSAFVHGGRLADAFSHAGIPVDYCVYPKSTPSLGRTPLVKKAMDMKLDGADKLAIVAPKNDDLVFVKHTFSLLQEGPYKPMIADLDNPSIIVGGVLAGACVKYTLRDLLGLHDTINVIIAQDAINLENQSPEDYRQSVLNVMKRERPNNADRLFIAGNDELIAAL